MNVSLTPKLEQFLSGKVQSGRYNSSSEVVREAHRLLEEHASARATKPEGFNAELSRRLAELSRCRAELSRRLAELFRRLAALDRGNVVDPWQDPRPIAAQVQAAPEAPRVNGYVVSAGSDTTPSLYTEYSLIAARESALRTAVRRSPYLPVFATASSSSFALGSRPKGKPQIHALYIR
jgi:antitoxin ParD1/3/4